MASLVQQGSYLSYPAPPGDKQITMKLVAGPAAYVAITPATPPTGGLVVQAADIGLSSIEFMFTAVSDNGQYIAYAMPAAAQTGPQTSIRLMITTANGGAEAAGDLSARSFLLCAIGY